MRRLRGPLALAPALCLTAGWLALAEGPRPPGPDYRSAIARAAPSVVRVETTGTRARGDDPLRRLFQEVESRDGGAGVVVGPRRVLTHAALIRYQDGAYVVTTASGRRHPAVLASWDPERRLALLETAHDLDAPALTLGASQEVAVGASVLALGDPFGSARDAQPAASLGVLEGRLVLDSLETALNGEVLLTDAAVNPGSEGGPLLDLEGRCLGILGPLLRDRRTGTLVGHAVPVEQARLTLARAASSGRLGLRGRSDPAGGVVVAEVEPGGPAERAGLRPGDRIVAGPGGAALEGTEALRRLSGSWPLELTIERAGSRLTVRLEEAP